MTYEESLEYIYSLRKVQKSSSHERIEALLSALGEPHKKLRFVHVVGTNGKGSVSGALSEIFRKADYKTGLFTSPFVVEFGERIQINGEYIDRQSLCEITEKMKKIIDTAEKEMMPTVFEMITALALFYFEREKCDVVILEAGIGGEHDSTNIIPAPLASVFTSVSLDHTEMLGDTVTKIAEEKCGVIKEGSLVVSYPFDGEELGFIPQNCDAARVIEKRAKEKNCPLYVPETDSVKIIRRDIEGSVFTYKKLTIRTSLCADHQIANMLTVAECALALGEKGENIKPEHIEKGIEGFFIPGRMEKISREPLIILDGGHNEGCMLALRDMAEKHLQGKKITALMASMKDKDYEKSLEIIAPLCENMVLTCTDKLRGERSEVLKECALKHCKNAFSFENPEEALEKALVLTPKDAVLLVCGSFYLVSDVRNWILNK